VPEELWTEVPDIVQEAVINEIPKKKKCKEAKCLSEEALQIAEKRREAKRKGKKERYRSQELPGVTGKFGLRLQNEAGPKANRVLPRERTGQSKTL